MRTGHPHQQILNAVVVDDAVGHGADDVEIELARRRATRRRGAKARLGKYAVVCAVLSAGVEHHDYGSGPTAERVDGHRCFVQLTVVGHGVGTWIQPLNRVADQWGPGGPVVQPLLLAERLDVVGRRSGGDGTDAECYPCSDGRSG